MAGVPAKNDSKVCRVPKILYGNFPLSARAGEKVHSAWIGQTAQAINRTDERRERKFGGKIVRALAVLIQDIHGRGGKLVEERNGLCYNGRDRNFFGIILHGREFFRE